MSAKHRRFDALIGALTDDLFRYAYWLCRDPHMAEELVQDTLLRAWRFMDSLKDTQAVKAWLIVTLRREYARSFERKRFDYADVDLSTIADRYTAAPDTSTDIDTLRRHMAALPEDYREPLALQVLLGCNTREIAEAMQISENAVTTRLFRARKKLRASVETHRATGRGSSR